MNPKIYVANKMDERFFAWYRPGWIKDYEAIKEELLNLNWLTKRTARHEYFMAEKQMDYSYVDILPAVNDGDSSHR